MSETSKKQTFLQGTVLLAAATAMVKVIGALYKIPLKGIIDDTGFSYFDTAYQIYAVLLLISTAGLPVAMSRMISHANSLGQYQQVRKIYSVSRTIFLLLGLFSALLMGCFSGLLAQVYHQPGAQLSIIALAPAAFLICLMSTYRGFFQGQGNMLPTSVSQVLEAIAKLVVGIALAALVIYAIQGDIPWAAAGAIFGVTISCLVSALYLSYCYRKAIRNMPVTQEVTSSKKEIAKSLLSIAIPITIGSAGLQLLNLLEIGIYMDNLAINADGMYTLQQLQEKLTLYGYNGETPLAELTKAECIEYFISTHKGIYNFACTFFNLPGSFITPITISIIPAITAQLALNKSKDAKVTGESAVRICALIAMPCSFGLILIADPLMRVLGYSGEKLELAVQLMMIMGSCVVFNAFVLLTNAIMQAYGREKLPVINMFVGGFVKLGAVYLLTKNPDIGIMGAPIGSLLCYLCIMVLNLFTMRKVLKQPPAILKNMLRAFLSAVLMGICVVGALHGLEFLMGDLLSGIIASVKIRALLSCAIPVCVGVVVYAIAVIKLRAITREDCLLLPKGEKIANLLHL